MSSKLRLCSGGGGYELLPDGPRSLDLARIRHRLEEHGIPVVDARVLLIATVGPEVTISRRGRLLFKTSDPDEADRTYERLLALIPQLAIELEEPPRRPAG
jgi:hypothetical protein